MSTITVTNIKATGETASRSATGVAGAWVNFDGTGTIATRDSVNVASLTDNGTGDYSINFSNSFSSVNFASSGFCGEDGNMASFRNGISSNSASSQRVAATLINGSRNDQSLYTSITHGDLA